MGRNGRSSGGGGSGGGSAGRTGSFGSGPQGHARRTGSFGGSSGRSSGGRSSGGGGFGGFDFGGPSGRSVGPGGSRRAGGAPPTGGFGGPVFPPGGGRGPVIPPPVVPPPVGGYGRVRSGGGMPRAGCATAVIALIVVALLVVMAMAFSGGTDASAADREITESSVARTKLEGTTYQNEVYDEIGWLNTANVADGLRGFYEKTGVQPAIYLTDRPDLIGDPEAQKAEAERLAAELGLSDSTFLYVYYDNNGSDGDWAVWTGGAAGTVMDDEALNIFEDYLTLNWFSDKGEDDVFIDTFNSTGERIMSRTTNANDVAIWVWIALGVVAAGVVIYVIMKTRRKHEAERAAETERILKTDIKDLDDPLLGKYSDDKK